MCANLINLQKNDKQTVFEVYLTLTMPLNHVFRFLFKYGVWYLNCTYNYVCSPTKYENIWTNRPMGSYNSSVTLLTHAHFVSTAHMHNISSICLLFMFNYYKMLKQSYIYKLVWKMQTVNCQCYTPDILWVFTLNLSPQKIIRYNVIMNVSWSFTTSQKNANIECWKINVSYIYMLFILMN